MTFETRGLSFGYAKDRTIFENIGFSVGKGEIFCILGPNGTGKTSLLRCLSGISMPLTGSVTIDGKDLHSLSRAEVAKRLRFMPQLHSSIFPFTALEVAVMGRSPHLGIAASPSARDYDMAWKNLELLGISSLAEKPYTRISGGGGTTDGAAEHAPYAAARHNASGRADLPPRLRQPGPAAGAPEALL